MKILRITDREYQIVKDALYAYVDEDDRVEDLLDKLESEEE